MIRVAIRDVTIGDEFIPKRGRRLHQPFIVKQVWRPDRMLLAEFSDGRRCCLRWRQVTRDFKPAPAPGSSDGAVDHSTASEVAA